MRKIWNMLLLTVLVAAGCGDGYDDTRIRQDLDEIGSRLDALEQSVAELAEQYNVTTEELLLSNFGTGAGMDHL